MGDFDGVWSPENEKPRLVTGFRKIKRWQEPEIVYPFNFLS
jgi:hypothetical protein